MAEEKSERSTADGAAIYSAWKFLIFYDYWVLGFSNMFVWRCGTKSVLLPFFQKHLTRNHMDIGVASGYYLLNSPRLAEGGHMTLLDLNPDSLATTAERLHKKFPNLQIETHQADILGSDIPVKPKSLDSISLYYLLHCLPGPPSRKVAALERCRTLLTKDGILYGSTVLGKGVEHHWLGRYIMRWYNREGHFGNVDDAAEDFLQPLQAGFEEVEWKIEGKVLLFAARGPKL